MHPSFGAIFIFLLEGDLIPRSNKTALVESVASCHRAGGAIFLAGAASVGPARRPMTLRLMDVRGDF